MSLHIYDRLSYISRIVDGLPPWHTRTFEEIYDAWKLAKFFDNIITRGELMIQYPNSEYILFDTSNYNRHVALALSTYIASTYHSNDLPVVIRSPHEISGDFSATFNRQPNGIYTYKREDGSIVNLRFDTRRPSQFINTQSEKVISWDDFTQPRHQDSCSR